MFFGVGASKSGLFPFACCGYIGPGNCVEVAGNLFSVLSDLAEQKFLDNLSVSK